MTVTMVATVVKCTLLLLMLKTTQLRLKLIIPTKLMTKHAASMQARVMLKPLDSKEFQRIVLKNSKKQLLLVQFQLLSKPIAMISKPTKEVSSTQKSVETNLTTVFSLLDMVLTTDKNTTSSRTHGVLDGVIKVTSRSLLKKAKVSAVSKWTLSTQYLPAVLNDYNNYHLDLNEL